MKFKGIILLCGLVVSATIQGFAQSKIDPKDISHKMQWFGDAKLGIFIMREFMPSMGSMNRGAFTTKK